MQGAGPLLLRDRRALWEIGDGRGTGSSIIKDAEKAVGAWVLLQVVEIKAG